MECTVVAVDNVIAINFKPRILKYYGHIIVHSTAYSLDNWSLHFFGSGVMNDLCTRHLEVVHRLL